MLVSDETNFSTRLSAEVRGLRAYARLMTNDRTKADEGVKDILKLTAANEILWRAENNLRIELFRLLHKQLLASDHCVPGNGHKVEDQTYTLSASVENVHRNDQALADIGPALLLLSFEDREAIILSAAAGFSDLDTAKICDCAPKIVASRVHRGRAQLAGLLHIEFANDVIAPDAPKQSVLSPMTDEKSPSQIL